MKNILYTTMKGSYGSRRIRSNARCHVEGIAAPAIYKPNNNGRSGHVVDSEAFFRSVR